MKNLATILSSLALVGVIALFVLHFSHDKKHTGNNNSVRTGGNTASGSSMKIAYVDIDTFEANFEPLKTKRAEFERRQSAAESELQRSAQQYQNTVRDLQQKAATMTESEGKAAEQKVMQMQESLRLREQSLSEQIGKDQELFNKQLKGDLDSFLAQYNKDAGYAYIFSHSKALPLILHADKSLDITQDVIKGMNEKAKK